MTIQISIITAIYNAEIELEYTVESLKTQSGRLFEWIVVDGGSRDATMSILKENKDLVTRLLTGPDAGMYDAWNKAINVASGNWLLFLGAGDELASPGTLEAWVPVLDKAYPNFEMVYGRIQLAEQGSRRVLCEVGRPWEELASRWTLFRPALPCHPEVFHHRSIFERGERFNTDYRFAADTEFMLHQAAHKPFLYVPLPVTKMTLGGQSGQLRNLRRISEETREIAINFGHRAPFLHRCSQHIKLVVAQVFVKLFSQRTVENLEVGLRRLIYRQSAPSDQKADQGSSE